MRINNQHAHSGCSTIYNSGVGANLFAQNIIDFNGQLMNVFE